MLSLFLRYRIKIIFCFFVYLGGIPIIAGFAQSDVNTLDRNLEPVIVTGLDEFIGAWVGEQNNELFLYAYRASEPAWEQIPFQIDEVVMSGENPDYFIIDDGQWDVNDELVFMAKDAGDRALDSWIDDISSQGFFRYEIQVTDPTAINKKAWVYLYRSITLQLDPQLNDYIDYFESTTNDIAKDRILSQFYELENSKNGFPRVLKIPISSGGSGLDYLDLLKFRATINIPVVGNENISEENFRFYSSRDDSVRSKDGRVRVIRELEATIYIDMPWWFPGGDQYVAYRTSSAFYYPYSTIIIVEIPEFSGASISSGRMSFDLDARVENANTKFVSAKNPEPGLIIDGNPELPNKIIDDVLPDSNWVYINGDPHGTIIHLFPLSTTVGQTRSLYYVDTNSKVGGDTGDNKSFGDTGIEISGGIAPPFVLKYKGYFLSKDSTSSQLGANLAHYEKNPLQILTAPQDFSTVPVELVSFNAAVEQRDVYLTWVTATESNNFGFDIERKNQKTDDWRQIDFLSGKGTTSNPVQYEYVDLNLQSGVYDYRLKQIDLDGLFEYSDIVTAEVGLPQTFALSQNYPNPFNPVTEIQYQLPNNVEDIVGNNRTILKIYNLLGKEVKTLVDKEQNPGFYTVSWDGHDNSGYQAPSGVYIYRLVSGRQVATKKMLLIR